MNEWEAIYADLDAVLSSLPFAKMNGEATYLIVDYGDHQHKVECWAEGYFGATVLAAIQAVIRKHVAEWEVILIGGPKVGPQQAVSIFPDSVVERWSTAKWYEDDDK